jgi:transposase-like protein
MARRRLTPEQVVRKLREADRLLGEGADIAAVARHLEVTEATYHRWRNQYDGLKADDTKRLKELERENARLKRCKQPASESWSQGNSPTRSHGGQRSHWAGGSPAA